MSAPTGTYRGGRVGGRSGKHGAPYDVARDDVLVTTLELAVPLWVEHWRPWPADHRVARAIKCGEQVTHYGDQILYRSPGRKDRLDTNCDPPVMIKGSPGTAAAFNYLAEGIALAAFQPGGINIFDRHWHVDCPARQPWPDDCIDLAEAS